MSSHDSKRHVTSDQRDPVLYELPVWAHYFWLFYLGFLFTPLFAPEPRNSQWLWPTVLSIPIFLFLYTRVIQTFRHRGLATAGLPEVLTIAVLAYALVPFNESANVYLIYSLAVMPFAVGSLRHIVVLVLTMLAGFAVELGLLGFRPLLFAITSVVAIVAALSNFLTVENRRKNIALRLSREEVHRMARVAERERIGRDLHDLLGHTLSLIALKSELAAKLLERDRATAAREIAEVTSIARDALKQVRTAVAGIRAAALENEIASARALLHTSGIALVFERDGAVLPAEIETTLAMIVREAVTNIQRHSGAREARIEVLTEAAPTDQHGGEKAVYLRVSDDGRGGITARGNGLTGISERVRSLGGALEIESPRGKGTTLRVRLPLVGLGSGVSETGARNAVGAMAVVGATTLGVRAEGNAEASSADVAVAVRP